MSAAENITLHKNVIRRAQSTLPPASSHRLEIITRAIAGIRRALSPSYNDHHYEG